MTSGSTKVRIKKGFDWDVEFSYKGKRLTGGAWRATSYIEENQFRADNRINSMRDDSFWSYPADEHNTYIREQLTLGIGECIYGFGEKFTTFVKNGQNVEMWNSDGGTCSDQSYKCVPFTFHLTDTEFLSTVPIRFPMKLRLIPCLRFQ